MTSFDRSRQLVAEAGAYLPGGVSSNFRLGISPTPLVFERADGPYLYDVDGNRYVDYVLSWGPLILGHAHPGVVAAIAEQAARGTSFGAPTHDSKSPPVGFIPPPVAQPPAPAPTSAARTASGEH